MEFLEFLRYLIANYNMYPTLLHRPLIILKTVFILHIDVVVIFVVANTERRIYHQFSAQNKIIEFRNVRETRFITFVMHSSATA